MASSGKEHLLEDAVVTQPGGLVCGQALLEPFFPGCCCTLSDT
jgi:hypothetical protein